MASGPWRQCFCGNPVAPDHTALHIQCPSLGGTLDVMTAALLNMMIYVLAVGTSR